MVSLGSANAWSRSVVQRSMPWRSASARSLSSLRPTRTGSGQIMRPSRVGTPPCSRMATIDRTRCWLVPMRPVTPFMITPSRILPAGCSGCLWAVRAGIVFTLRGHILSSAMADARRRSSRANVTISDVAGHAGVSPATVSRVLNGGYPVAEVTRLQVQKVVNDLGYIRNAHAQALRGTSTGVVGVNLHDVADPYFSEIVDGIQEVATAHRRLVVLCNSLRDPENELQYVQMLRG